MNEQADNEPRLFVHSVIDDAGLTAGGFCILGHLARPRDCSGALISGYADYPLFALSSRNRGGTR
jgi:hypothetical protein